MRLKTHEELLATNGVTNAEKTLNKLEENINKLKNTTPEQYLKRFKEITEEMYNTSKKKNSDYTADCGDAFANFKLVEEMGICSTEAGFLTRLSDKFARLVGLVKNKECQVKDEKYTDTLLDMANYCILLCIYLENKGDLSD